MPPRVARSSVAQPAKRKSVQKNRKRQLDAFAIAGKVAPEKSRIRSHRLGEVEDEQPRGKRRRNDDDDEDELEEEDEKSARDKRRRRDDDDNVEYGSDSEGNEWTIGEVADDDDESLDSDEAFGESDEERFEGFTFRGSSTNKHGSRAAQRSAKRAAGLVKEIDLNEDNSDVSMDEDEDDFGEEGVDLATMLDEPASDQEEDEDEEGDSDSSHTESEQEEDEDLDDEERHARLQDFVDGLDKSSSKNKPIDVDDSAGEPLTLDDLLEDADLDSKTLATLKPKKKSKAAELVKAALPKRQQDQIDRKLAAAKAKEQLDRWKDTVIQNRRADFLSFPLRDPDQREPQSKDTFTPAQQDAPVTDLEANIRQIMEESGMVNKAGAATEDAEHDLLKAEELGTQKMDIEEVLARRAELRRTRELLFREEIKAKRIAKIKSKAYRRVHRKERERLADKERMLLDPEGYSNGELNEDEQELADRARAEARMNAKHRHSKWAKSLRATDRATWDDDARAGVIEQARRQEELKRRIAGKDIDDGDSESEDVEELNEIQQLQKLANSDSQGEKKGLASMKFMQNAQNRRKAANNAAIAELQKMIDPDAAEEEDSGIEDKGLGRAIFGPKKTATDAIRPPVKRNELEEGLPSDDEEDIADDKSVVNTMQREPSAKPGRGKKGSGPLAQVKTMPQAQAQATNEEPASIKSAWLSAPKDKKSKLDRKLARNNDNEAIIDTRIYDDKNISKAAKPATDENTAAEQAVSNTDGWTTVTYAQKEDDEDEDEEAPMLTKAERNAAFHARAFAGDDVALQFNAEKDAMIASEDEKETSSHMPGWGSWAGAGLTKAARKAAERARHHPLHKTKQAGTRSQDRKDAKLENVIISEKTDRRGKKYLAPILPHQYEQKEEYERALRMPIGPEWSTKEVFQKSTRPRVVVKAGTVIEPMSRPLV